MDKLSQKLMNWLQGWGYTEDDFDTDQLAELYLGLKNGLSKKQILTYVFPNLTADQMAVCRQYAEGGFGVEQLKQISIGLMHGITESQIKLYADLKYDNHQMAQIRLGMEEGLAEDQIKLYADEKYSWQQMWKIGLQLKNGLSIKEIKEKYIFFQPKIDDMQQAEYEVEM